MKTGNKKPKIKPDSSLAYSLLQFRITDAMQCNVLKVARLDFWGWYLPNLSINYVGMNKDMEKKLPQLYYIKMKISYDLGLIAIGVAMAT